MAPHENTANLDDLFTVAVVVSNVSDLYGFDIQFSWDPTLLEYVSHVPKIPVDSHPDGALHPPTISVKNEVNATAGTCWIAYASLAPAPSFNGTGEAFEMTFRVVGIGSCALEVVRADLANSQGQPLVVDTQNGGFRTKAQTLPTNMPVVLVAPQETSAIHGETITVSVKIFNLTDSIYASDTPWSPGEGLPPPGARFYYTLGNLYGLDIQLSWDPSLLEYVDHTVTIPVEAYLEGVLHEPIIDVKDSVDVANGTYWLAQSSQAPASAFNSPNANATVFIMTFKVKRPGVGTLALTSVDLAADPSLRLEDSINRPEIPHRTFDGRVWANASKLPVADFEYAPRNPMVNQTVTFNASASFDPDGHIVTYAWDFGDGSLVEATAPRAYHAYNASGTYEVVLQVIDNEGYSESVSQLVHVRGPVEPTPKMLVVDAPGSEDTGALDVLHYDYSVVSASEFTEVDLYQYAVLFIGWNPGNTLVDALLARAADIAAWVAAGNGIVALAEYKETNRWAWLPLYVASSSTTGDDVAILDPFHPVMHNLTDAELSAWGNSYHGYFYSYDASWEPLAEGLEVSYAITLAALHGSGRIAITCQDADFHLHYERERGAEKLLRNMIEWATCYTPSEHDVAVSVSAPEFLMLDESAQLNATVYNLGLSDETDVEFQLEIDGDVAARVTVSELASGTAYILSHPWSPAGEGTYNITASAIPVLGENNTANNKATCFVKVARPLIAPEEGQYAHYLMTVHDHTGQMPGAMKLNITYLHYVEPHLINVSMLQQDPSGATYTSWILVNVLTREMIAGPYTPAYYYYFGWIETNITVGSTVKLLDTHGQVKGSQTIEAAGSYIDCWVVEMTMASGYYEYNYTMWYDKATGLWVGMKYSDYYAPEYYALVLLADTNIPVGGALRVETDRPMYTRLEVVTISATFKVAGAPVENATITFQVNYPNGTVCFIWTEATDANGTATLGFFVDDNMPYGTYTLYATAYKLGLEPRTASTTCIIAYLEPSLTLWFAGPDVALIGDNATVTLHVYNTGNGTAYNIAAKLVPPCSLDVIWANATFSGTIDPDQEVRLTATVTEATPSRHLLTASTTYEKVDGTPMPTVHAERILAFAYHEDYPLDLIEMIITATPEHITLDLTVVNYGDSPVEVTLIASARHTASKLMLSSVYQTIVVNPNETITLSLSIAVPASAPAGEYVVQGILATQLPIQEGFTLARKQETASI